MSAVPGIDHDEQDHIVEPRRLGLALSGGGFRASFFHIGALARLAELDLLRYVEVLSTVSGGSIVGVLYYLHVKNLLERKEGDPGRDDYIEIVQAIEEDFLWASQKNIRARIFWNPLQNVHMAWPSYSRTSRVGSQLEKFLYRPVWCGEVTRLRRIRLRDLTIAPGGDDTSFQSSRDNANRHHAKVPVLLINATTLNTGRNWRFEAVRMGESLPRDKREAEIALDLNPAFLLKPGRLLPGTLGSDVALGLAVAASAAVPTLFHPVTIKKMYKLKTREGKTKRISVGLVDGGVHDNQGVQGLFDHKCTHLIVSDASGQYLPLYNPDTKIPAVATRVMSIYGARLRQEQLARGEGDGKKEPFALIHLRKGLSEPSIDPGVTAEDDTLNSLTEFGICRRVQYWLSHIRTDLDNFGDVEAGALMLDGYKMMDLEMSDLETTFNSNTEPSTPLEPDAGRWHFCALDPLLAVSDPNRRVERRLTVGTRRFVKPLRFFDWLPYVLGLLLGAGLGVGAYILFTTWSSTWDAVSSPKWPAWLVVVSVVVAAFIGMSYFAQARQPGRWLAAIIFSRLLPVALAIPLWLMATTQLLFNRFYLSRASYHSVGLPKRKDHSHGPATSFSKRPNTKVTH
jgi:NTE family protein